MNNFQYNNNYKQFSALNIEKENEDLEKRINILEYKLKELEMLKGNVEDKSLLGEIAYTLEAKMIEYVLSGRG